MIFSFLTFIFNFEGRSLCLKFTWKTGEDNSAYEFQF